MQRIRQSLFWSVNIGWLVALWVSIYPGALEDVLLLVLFLGVPIAIVLGWVSLIALILIARREVLTRLFRCISQMRLSRRQTLQMVITSGLAAALIHWQIPMRLAFSLSQPAFEALRQQAPIAKSYSNPDRLEMQLHRFVGLYWVDEYAGDRAGRAYFRVYSGHLLDWLGETSYGFAYRPNRSTTPFGVPSQFLLLNGDWYGFRAYFDSF